MKKILIAAGIVAFLAGVSHTALAQGKGAAWPKEPDSVFGIKLGQPLNDDLIPYCIDDEPPKPGQLSLCSEDPRDGRGISEISRLPIPEFGNGLISRHQGVVSSIAFYGSNDNYQRIKDVLVERYGRPASAKLDSVQNKAGASFRSEELTWRGARVSLVLEQRSGKVGNFLITFTHMPTAKAALRQEEKKTKSAADLL